MLSANPSFEIAYDDCRTVFRALCKLSSVELPEMYVCLILIMRLQVTKLNPNSIRLPVESIEVKSKILALELIVGILTNAGPVFRNSERFTNRDFKKFLCPSIGTNGPSPIPRVFQLTLNIFSMLTTTYKEHLKVRYNLILWIKSPLARQFVDTYSIYQDEIGLFFTRIFLKILESDNSTVQHKGMLLDCLLQICHNPQSLVDIFVNYDCSLESQDIFGRSVQQEIFL